MNLWTRFQRWRDRHFWQHIRATHTLHNAWDYLWAEYWSTAANRDRGFITRPTQEALDILHMLASESLERSLEG